MKRTRIHLAAVAALSALVLTAPMLGASSAAADGPAVSLYAAPAGSGDDCTAAAPCALTTAQQHARDNAASEADVDVVLADGVYTLTSPLQFDANDSAHTGHMVTYKAAAGANPVLSGGTAVTGWAPSSENPDIYVADVPGSLDTRQLFVDGVRATRARGSVEGFTTTSSGTSTLVHNAPSTAMAGWGNKTAIEFVYQWEWTQSRCTVASISGAAITMKPTCVLRMQAKKNPVWVENAHELLDEPGEWYLDKTAHRLYYQPRPGEDLSTASVIAPTLESLIVGTGTLADPVANIEFRGITFADTTWTYPSGDYGFREVQANLIAPDTDVNRVVERDTKTPAAVTFNNVVNVRFLGNSFTRLGAAGLELEGGAQSNVVRGNRVFDISGNGIMLGGVTAQDHHPSTESRRVKNNEISNNYITRVGQDYAGAVGIWVGYAEATYVEHNELHDLPYSAISVGWGWGTPDWEGNPSASKDNLVAGNLAYDFMKVVRDGGGIYSLGEQRGEVIERNVLYGQVNDYSSYYLDDGSKGVTVRDNIGYDNHARNLMVKGRDHVIEGNYWDDDSRNQYFYEANVTFTDNVVGPISSFPLDIMNEAGLESDYYGLRGTLSTSNLARGAHVAPSFTSPTGDSNAIVDGNTSSGSTTSEGQFIVDPGRVASLGAIVVSFPYGEAPLSYDVDVADESGEWSTVAADVAGDNTRDLVVLDGALARQVRVTSTVGSLTLAEIEIYGAGAPVPVLPQFQLRVVNDTAGGVTSSSSAVSVTGSEIEGASVGTATVTAATWEINVVVTAPTGYSLWKSAADVAKGKPARVALNGEVDDKLSLAVPAALVTYESDAPSIIDVGAQGALDVTSTGTAVIEAVTLGTGPASGVTRSVELTAFSAVLTDVESVLSDDYLHPGADSPIEIERAVMSSGYDALVSSLVLTYDSADESVATVDAAGVVTAIAPGATQVAVTATLDGTTITRDVEVSVHPTGWEYAGVAVQPGSGTAAFDGEEWHVEGKSRNIYGRFDNFQFVYQPIDLDDYPDGVAIESTVTQLAGGSADAMTGVMLRQSVDTQSANVNYRIHYGTASPTKTTVPLTWRASTGDLSYNVTGATVTLPARIRLVYKDGIATAYSWDSTALRWVARGATPIVLSGTILAGVAHASVDEYKESLTTFSTPIIEAASELPISISGASTLVEEGEDLQLEAGGLSSSDTLAWTTSDAGIATVDSDGLVSGVATGEVIIHAETGDGRSAEYPVSVFADAEALTLRDVSRGKPSSIVATNMVAALSSQANGQASKGNDGDLSTVAQASGSYAWGYRIDLGSVQTVGKLETSFPSSSYATKFEFVTSLDGAEWTTAHLQESSVGATVYTHELAEPRAARYVGVRALKPDTVNPTGNQMAVRELVAYAYHLPIPVSGVSAARSDVSVGLGGVEKLGVVIAPADAANDSVTWSSSDPSVVTVSADGSVTGVALGTATVTATTVDGGYQAAATVRVRPVSYLSLNATPAAFASNMTTTLSTHASTPLSNGNDGNLSTTVQASGAYAWAYRLDLGSSTAADALAVSFSATNFATSFEFLTSNNGTDWTTRRTLTSTTGGTQYWLDLPAGTSFRYAAVRALTPNASSQTGNQMAIREFSVLKYRDVTPTLSNSALGKSASVWNAGMTATLGTQSGRPAANGVDGSLSTVVQATGAWAWTYRVDLGAATQVWALDVSFPSGTYATSFEFLVSLDGTTWTTVRTFSSTSGLVVYRHDFPSATVIRYAAVRAITPNASGQPGAQMAIREFSVYAE